MIEIINNIISNVLTAFYQPFWFSMMAAILSLFLYLYVKEHGWREALRHWIISFKMSGRFRRLFFLAFFVMLMLMRTLMNRNMWANPVSDVMGGWTLWNKDGELTTEAIENVLLMMPYTALLLWAFKERLLERITLSKSLLQGIKCAFFTSITIELLQLFLRLGTFQVSDIFYNFLGGLLGSLIYYLGFKMKGREQGKRRK